MLMPRQCRQLARLVLAWFVLALAVAAAAPLVHAQDQQLVCTADGGVTLVDADGDAAPRGDAGWQHCPLCVLAGAPPRQDPSLLARTVTMAAPVATTLRRPDVTRSAPPLPARGPPGQS